MEQIEARLRFVVMHERRGFRAKYVLFTLSMSGVLRPKSSNLIVGIDFANKVTPSHGGIGL